jgi:hypothetical protein
MRSRTLTHTLAALTLAVGLVACSESKSSVHSSTEMQSALLEVKDLSFFPSEWQWEENMRKVIPTPVAPWENTLDPYLCPEAGTPKVLTTEQAQLELTGGSVMEILLSSKDAKTLYGELKDAYGKCIAGTSTAYTPLDSAPTAGDESASYRTQRGVVTIARFDKDLMILKWWVGDYWPQVNKYYPNLVAAATKKVTDL